MSIFLFLMGMLIFLCVWGLICNSRTNRQRRRMIRSISKYNRDHIHTLECIKMWDYYEDVDYDDHMWALFWMKDWRELYSEELRNKVPRGFE